MVKRKPACVEDVVAEGRAETHEPDHTVLLEHREAAAWAPSLVAPLLTSRLAIVGLKPDTVAPGLEGGQPNPEASPIPGGTEA